MSPVELACSINDDALLGCLGAVFLIGLTMGAGIGLLIASWRS